MPKYEVIVERFKLYAVIVEAETPEEAEAEVLINELPGEEFGSGSRIRPETEEVEVFHQEVTLEGGPMYHAKITGIGEPK